jgi:serine/threonine-protein kinase
VVLFECVAGCRPFEEGNAVAIATAHLSTPAPDLPADVPPAVQEIVRTALAKDPADRFQSAADFAAAAAAARGVVESRGAPTAVLRAAVLPTAVPAVPVGSSTTVLEPAPAAARRDPRWRWIAPVVIGLLLIGALVLIFDGNPDVPTDRPATTSSPRVTRTPSPALSVPADLVGRSRDDAAAAVRKAGLEPRFESRVHTASAGTVVEVRPAAGTRVQRSDAVTLVVSAGSDRTDDGDGEDDGEKDDDKRKGKGDDKKKDG